MKRRSFIALLGAAATWPRAARAQPPESRVRRIGVLMGSAPSETGQRYLAAFSRRLEQLGWSQGGTARIDIRWWTGGPQEMRPVITELISSAPDVIMVFSNLALSLLSRMTASVPIVFVGVGDPIGDGFVASLSRPGGNMTGFAGTDGPIGGKWIQVLKEAVPQLARAMMIYHPETPIHQEFWRAAERAAPRFGVELSAGGVHDAAEIERTFQSFAAVGPGGVIVAPHAITWANEDVIIALALRHRLPSHFATAASVMGGGLISYGHDFEDSFRKTAEYVDRVLRGEKPSDLPVQMPTKFRLIANLKTAKAIGLELPADLLVRADEVIE
jgi:putative tryptophan/tyrosine transport system substrate-binding protein